MQENCAKVTVNNFASETLEPEHGKDVQNDSSAFSSPELNTNVQQTEDLASPLNLVERDKEARVSVKGASIELKRALGEIDTVSMEQRIAKLVSTLYTSNRLAVVVFGRDDRPFLVRCASKSKDKLKFYGLETKRLEMERSLTTPGDASKDSLEWTDGSFAIVTEQCNGFDLAVIRAATIAKKYDRDWTERFDIIDPKEREMLKDKESWYLSISAYLDIMECKTVEANRNKDTDYSDSYVPTQFFVSNSCVKNVLKETILRHSNTTADKELIGSTFGYPVYVNSVNYNMGDKTRGPRKNINLDSSVKDKQVINRFWKLKNYIRCKEEQSETTTQYVKRVMDRISILGQPDALCVNILKELKGTFRTNTKPKFKIGAYLYNAGVFIEYTHEQYNSKELAWKWLAYENGSRFQLKVIDMPKEQRDIMADLIFGSQLERVKPRIFCIIEDLSINKVLNGSIFDIVNNREKILEGEYKKQLSRCFVPRLYTPKDEQSKVEELYKKKLETLTILEPTIPFTSLLPATKMTRADKHTRKASNEEKSLEESTRQKEDSLKKKEKHKNSHLVFEGWPNETNNNGFIQQDGNLENNTQLVDTVAQDGNASIDAHVSVSIDASERVEEVPEASIEHSIEVQERELKNMEVPCFKTLDNKGDLTINIVLDKHDLLQGQILIKIQVGGSNECPDMGSTYNEIQLSQRSKKSHMSNNEKIDKLTSNNQASIDRNEDLRTCVPENMKVQQSSFISDISDNNINEVDSSANAAKSVKRPASAADSSVRPKNMFLDIYPSAAKKPTGKEAGNKWRPKSSTAKEWYNERKKYIAPDAVKKHIPSMTLRNVRRVLKSTSAHAQIRTLLMLPQNMIDNKGAIEKLFPLPYTGNDIAQDSDEVLLKKRRDVAIGQFYRGEWAKAFKTLLGKQSAHIAPSKQEIDKLYPSAKKGDEFKSLHNAVSVPKSDVKFITTKDVEIVVKKLPNRKACGTSGLTYEHMKEICKEKDTRVALSDMYNRLLCAPDAIAHQQLYCFKMVCIKKKDGGIRPICIQESIIKILHKILTFKLSSFLRESMGRIQFTLALTEGQLSAKTRVLEAIEDGFNYTIQFDFSNAFGTVSRKEIIDRLEFYKVPKVIINYIEYMFSQLKIEYCADDGTEVVKNIERGMPQGDPLSMLCFGLGVDRILCEMEKEWKCCVTAYADDIILQVKDGKDVIPVFEAFAKKASECGLSINISKSKIATKGEASVELLNECNERGLEMVDVTTDHLEYLGLPITLNPLVAEKFMEGKCKALLAQVEELWGHKIPLQMMYHLQRLCLDSKVIYWVKGIPLPDNEAIIGWMTEVQDRLDAVFSKVNTIPAPFRYIPTDMLGAGLMNIIDLRNIRKRFEERDGKEKRSEREIKEKYYEEKIKKCIQEKSMPRYEWKGLPKLVNLSINSPPTSETERLGNLSFKMMWATRYCSTAMDSIATDGAKDKLVCKFHPKKKLNLSHILSCPQGGAGCAIKLHNAIVRKIAHILMRNDKVSCVEIENYSIEQQEMRRLGLASKRADITYMLRTVQHSIDVSVTSSWAEFANGNSVLAARKTKERQYKDKGPVHIILFDLSGLMTTDAWEVMKGIGVTNAVFRAIQTLIYKSVAERYLSMISDAKYWMYRRKKNRDTKSPSQSNGKGTDTETENNVSVQMGNGDVSHTTEESN